MPPDIFYLCIGRPYKVHYKIRLLHRVYLLIAYLIRYAIRIT